MYLPHTWGGDTNLEEYYKTLKELDRNMQDIEQKYQISGIIAGMDAQAEVRPRRAVCWRRHKNVSWKHYKV